VVLLISNNLSNSSLIKVLIFFIISFIYKYLRFKNSSLLFLLKFLFGSPNKV